MADEVNQDESQRAVSGGPTNRDRPHDPGVIEGEVADATQAPASDEEVGAARESRSSPRPEGRLPAVLAGGLGGLIVSALAMGGAYFFYAPKSDLAQANAERLAGIEAEVQRSSTSVESQIQRESAAVAALDTRISALEGANPGASLTALDKRVSALEGGNGATGDANLEKRVAALEAQAAANGSKIGDATSVTQGLESQVKSVRADVDTARGAIAPLAERVAKLESAAPQAAAAASQLSLLSERLNKNDAALAAQTNELRAATEKPAQSPTALVVVADTVRDKLAAGAPLTAELSALQSLGVDPAKLQPLKALSSGGPTTQQLAASFEAVAPAVIAAASQQQRGGLVDRFLAHLKGLVEVRHLDEVRGDDPAALVSQIEADNRRGNFAGALAAYGKLPEAAKSPAATWAAAAQARQEAVAALQAIRDEAVQRIADGAKP